MGRPLKGMPLDEAFEQWSDPSAIGDLGTLAGTRDLPAREKARKLIPDVARHDEYCRKRKQLELEFCKQMKKGDRLASGLASGIQERVVIHPNEWQSMDVDFAIHQMASHARGYDELEFFEVTSIPLNIFKMPEWLEALTDKLDTVVKATFSTNFAHGRIGEGSFTLGPKTRKFIQILYRESLLSDAWQSTVDVLDEAGSDQEKLSELFRDVSVKDQLYETRRAAEVRLHPKLSITFKPGISVRKTAKNPRSKKSSKIKI